MMGLEEASSITLTCLIRMTKSHHVAEETPVPKIVFHGPVGLFVLEFGAKRKRKKKKEKMYIIFLTQSYILLPSHSVRCTIPVRCGR